MLILRGEQGVHMGRRLAVPVEQPKTFSSNVDEEVFLCPNFR